MAKTMNETATATVILNGQAASASLKEIEAAARLLNAELRKLPTNSKEFVEKTKEYKVVKERLTDVKNEINATGFSMKKLGDEFNRYQTLGMAVIGALVGIGAAIKGIVQGSAQLSDAFSDVQKTTGLSLAEVKELSVELGRINTRTAKKELLDLAYIAGKLGYSSKEDVLGFVKAADQINVALSKDLGGSIEDSVNTLGKLTDVFKLKDAYGVEQALLKTGSAINELGAASTANEAYLVEFTKRVGGIAPQAGVSIESVLGMAATLDQLGQSSEKSATAVSQLLTKMFQKPGEYAAIAGMQIKDFTTLMKTDANEALIKLLSGLQKNKGGLEELASKFSDLGIDGTRSIAVIGALSNNIELLRSSQLLANDAFAKGISLTEEFNIKNNNLAGNLEKVGKWFHKLVFNPTLTQALTDIVATFARWVEIPLSQAMEDERVKANALAMQLAEANISADERNKLYIELKSLAPSILEGIDRESIAYDKLTKNLAEYNDMMINKIILQSKDEEIVKARENVAEAREGRVGDDLKMRKKLISVVGNVKSEKGLQVEANALDQILLDAKLTLDEKKNKMISYIEQHKILDQNLALQIKAQDINTGFAGWAHREAEAVAELDRILKEKDVLKEMLGTGPAPKTPPTAAGGVSPSGEPTTKPKTIEELQAEAKRYAEYLKKINKDLQETLVQAIEDQKTKELALAELHMKSKLAEITGNTKAENDLRTALHEEYLTKVKQIEEKYAERKVSDSWKIEKETWEAKIKATEQYSPLWLIISTQYLEEQQKVELELAELTGADKLAIQKKYLELSRELEYSFQNAPVDRHQGNVHGYDKGSLVDKSGIGDEPDASFSTKADMLAAARDAELAITEGNAAAQLQIWQDYDAAYQSLLVGEVQTYVDNASQALSALQSIFQTIATMENANLQKDVDTNNKKKAKFKEQLDSKKINQTQYDKLIAESDEELDKKKRKLAHDQAVRAKELAIFEGTINLAKAVIQMMSGGPIIGLILAALAAVLGGIQLGYIISTPVPAAAKGRYNVIGEDDGISYTDVPYEKNPQTGIYSRPTLFAEKGDELIVDGPTTKNLQVNYPWVIDAIKQARVPQMATGNVSSTSSPGQVIQMPWADPGFKDSIDRLNANIEKGILAKIVWRDLEDATNTMNGIKNDVTPP